jgi:hypothetical protein
MGDWQAVQVRSGGGAEASQIGRSSVELEFGQVEKI